MSASIVEPHDKMRGRDVSRVAKGEQAPRPPQQSPPVSRPPPPSATSSDQFARKKGESRIIVESDSKLSIDALHMASEETAETGLIRQILELRSSFQHIAFWYVPRKGNKLADALTKMGDAHCFEEFVLERAPPEVFELVAEEAAD